MHTTLRLPERWSATQGCWHIGESVAWQHPSVATVCGRQQHKNERREAGRPRGRVIFRYDINEAHI